MPQYANINHVYYVLRTSARDRSRFPRRRGPALRPMLTFLTLMQYTIYNLVIFRLVRRAERGTGLQMPTGNEAEWFNNKDDRRSAIVGIWIPLRRRWLAHERARLRALHREPNWRPAIAGPVADDGDTRAPGAPSRPPIRSAMPSRRWRFQAPDRTGDYHGHNGD